MTAFMAARARSIAPVTLLHYEEAVGFFGKFLDAEYKGKPVTIDRLSVDMLGRFYDSLKAGRGAYTRQRIVEKIQGAWRWLFDTEWSAAVPRPKKIEMRKAQRRAVTAPTFAQMSACVHACSPAGCKRLAAILYFTGARTGAALAVRWSDLDEEKGTLTMPPSKGQPGYTIPLSPHFLALLKHWPRKSERLCDYDVSQNNAEVQLAIGWSRSGIPEHVVRQAPGKAFRRGLTSGLRFLNVDKERAELYVGRGVEGARKHYVDLAFVKLDEVANIIPNIEAPK